MILESDSAFDSSLETLVQPLELEPTPEEYAWMQRDPWRAPEAAHFLCLFQKLIYRGDYEGATRTALYLKYEFES